MRSAYMIEEIHIRSENRAADGLAFAIREGDILLDQQFRFELLPAARDVSKPISRRKVSRAPETKSKRLLRIKELGERAAVVAILNQESYFEDSDTIVTKEQETLVTVNYGEEFSVYAKQQWTDLRRAMTYRFVITGPANPQRRNEPGVCSACGAKLTRGDRFCRECGTSAGQ